MNEKIEDIESLRNLKDNEGLVDTSNIKLDSNGSMFIDKIEVESLDEIRELITFLKINKRLWSISKINLQKKEFGKSRSSAPIIGVPFTYGLDKVIDGSKNEKSMFYIDDQDLISKGIEGTLIANYNRRKDEIDFQLWEILPGDIRTYYVHGIYSFKDKLFSHFDGALIDLNEETKEKMKHNYFIPDKGFPYEKLFRLDGKIMKEDAIAMMNNYLPLEDLSREYGISPPIKENSL